MYCRTFFRPSVSRSREKSQSFREFLACVVWRFCRERAFAPTPISSQVFCSQLPLLLCASMPPCYTGYGIFLARFQ